MQKIRPDLDIGKQIKSIRNSRNMTQQLVVSKMQLMGLNITRDTYAKIESNTMNIKVSELAALTFIFGCNYNDFFAEIRLPEN